MRLAELYLSKPGVSFPEPKVDNAEILRRVRQRYRGAEGDWPKLASAIEHVWGICRTRTRHLADADERCVADYAVKATQHCLAVNDTTLDEVDLVICGGIARQYFEPATAMEVAAKLGLERMELARERRLGDVDQPGGRGHRARVDDGEEVADRPELHRCLEGMILGPIQHWT